MAKKKRVKMKKSTSSKGLLLEWLRKALDNQRYPGMMQWKDKKQEIFFIRWTHKSAEKWSDNDLAPFKDWAAHKGKLDGKNEKQLKATFRCALNSKTKELKELGRERGLRLWKFLDPNSEEAIENSTKTKKRKGGKSGENTSSPRTPRENTERTLLSDMSSLSICSNIEENVQSPCRLPAFESLPSPSFSPTPPHQALEISCNSPESKFSEDAFKTEEIFNMGSDIADRVTTCLSVNNIYTNTLQSPSSNTEFRTNYSPSPEHNCYSPPQSGSSPNSFHQTSADLWQANCWQSTQSYQDISIFNQFFTNEFTELYKSANKELENNMKLEPMEMDQFVPVTHQVYNTNIVPVVDQVYSNNDQLHCINKTDRVNSQQDLAKTDDYYLFSEEVDEEACSRIMLELERFSATPENRLYTYEN